MVLALTGVALVFERETERLLKPEWGYVTPRAERVPLEEAIANARTSQPGRRLSSIIMPDDVDHSIEVRFDAGTYLVFIDPYTGKVLGSRDREASFTGFMRRIHFTLLLGDWGATMAGVASLLLCVLTLTGLYLWWPRTWKRARQSFTVKWRAPWKRVNYDVHNVGGAYTWLLVFVMGLTGFILTFSSWTTPLILRAARARAEPPEPRSTIIESAGRLPLDSLLESAKTVMPSAHPFAIFPPHDRADAFMVILEPRRFHAAGHRRVYVDQYTGAVARVAPQGEGSLGHRIVESWIYGLHTGQVFGLSTRILWLIATAMAAILPVTGFLVWWRPERRKLRAGRRKPVAMTLNDRRRVRLRAP